MNFRGEKKRKAPSVIIVSLIDVLMVVLIFLVLSTTFKERLPINNVPVVRNPDGTVAPAGEHLIVTVRDRPPHLELESRSITIHELGDVFKQRHQRNTNTTLVIKANKLAPYGEVVSVRDEARSAGITKVYEVRQLPKNR